MIARQTFGRTGHMSTRTIFGAAAFGTVTQYEADQTMELLAAYGVNHVDTAMSYGESELRLGDWIRRHGRPAFLATKTGMRSYAEARAQIRLSLERLCVDSIDLFQMHNLIEPSEWELAFSEDGALRALVEAREQGLIRFIGVTGHGLTSPRQHLKALVRFDFDSVLLPLNCLLAQNDTYMADFQELKNICAKRNVAMQTIKSQCRRPWGEREKKYSTWYEPFDGQTDVSFMTRWLLNVSDVFLNTTADIRILPMILKAASETIPPITQNQVLHFIQTRDMQPLFV